jgi:hypothetical protein
MILHRPVEYDEEHYYDLLSEIFMLEEKTLQEGIRAKVKDFYKANVVEEPRLGLAYGSEFHLSP